MKNLIVDIGNTNTKFGIFEDNNLLEVKYNLALNETVISEWISCNKIEKAIISDVSGKGKAWVELLSKFIEVIKFGTQIKAGLTSNYQTQSTLGEDRWSKMIAVSRLNLNGDSLVVDAGTCITIDFLKKGNEYEGGSISPGIEMRFKALHQFTGKLPLIEEIEVEIPEGKNTIDAIKAGVLGGVCYEIEGNINYYKTKYPDLKIFLTGGNSSLLWSRLKSSIFAPQIILEPLLVLKGLNEVIKLETCS